MKQKHYIAGLYYRLSQEDERQGESVSIDNQRTILRKYAEERGFEIHDEYIDDGVSGTTFQRPEVQRLLDDAKTGVINTIIVKDLSRFGRNYIEVGQYVDYVFPAFGIRFIAIQDNIDTENRDSGAMEMMPIMNVFNEWHAANTSKKIRAVWKAKAKEGVFHGK
ncbi:MAG TPA: recombinase family protein, partial [Bacillota bacterium]|nr:recombinase family protein [Bacillota bacterium]HPP85995.1 recombinase family protein [Bacillota bacterium]